MRKINKKKLIIIIIMILVIATELLALRLSRAEKTITIAFNVSDYNQNLEQKIIDINAVDGGEAGYYITLPEVVENIKVKKYYIEEKSVTTIEENTVETGSTTENVTSVEKNAGDTVYLTTEEVENLEISIIAEYDTKEVNEVILYNTVISQTLDENNDSITLQTYLPIETTMELQEITEEENTAFVDELNNQNLLEEFSVKQVYSIKLINNEADYVSTDSEQVYKITIDNIDTTREYKIYQIKTSEQGNEKNNNIQEISEKTVEGTTINFETDNLNKFVILESNEPISEEIPPVLLMSTGNVSTFALVKDAPVWDGTIATGFEIGSGTSTEPYLISNGEELAYLAEQVNDGTTYEGIYFQLASDINLNNREWTPIGTYEDSFRGILDGAGHTIGNADITISDLATSVETYGIFGSIGGGNLDTELRNIQFENINITITASGNTNRNTTEMGYNIGFVTGTMFKNSTVKNVIVKGSTVTDTNTVTLRNNSYQVLVGGIAGDARNSSTSTTDPGSGSRYLIENCYVNAEITLDIALRNNTLGNAAQYYTGGIIGRIRSQAVWPTNCLFSGTIDSTNAFIGPIFGAVRNNTAITNTGNYATLWNGNDAGNLTMTSYYTNYTANGTVFTANQASGTSTSRIANQNNRIGYVQGVNKGLYTNDKNSRLDGFNSMSGGNYLSWKYESQDLSLIPRFSATPVQIQPNIYQMQIQDPYNTGTYTYQWYINGELDTSITGNTSPQLIPNFDTGYDVRVIMYDGTYYSIAEFEIPKLYIEIEFDVNETTDSVQASLTGSALPYVNLNDYTYTWYCMDITGTTTELQSGTSLTLNNLENAMEYKLVATNKVEPRASAENTFIYGTRNVIYVDYNDGNNNNNGFTPETAVQNLSTAYGKLPSEGSRNENIIVMMGNYTDTTLAFYNSRTNTTYAKKATITGKYAGVDYNAVWRFGSTSSNYYFRYLTEDLTIMNLTLNGGNGYMYLICQGHSFTAGEGVTMSNYTNASTNQGLLGNRAPGFHLFAGWYQYNQTKLPNNNCEIVLKSGTYGRVILGGTPGTSSGQGQTTSHDFMGSSMEDSFKVSILVDIQNSTTATNYDYDVNLLVGGSACGNNYSIVTENIVSGRVGRVLGGSIGDSAATLRNWNYPENTFLGETTINVSGGTIAELYGGCLGRNMNIVGSTTATGNTCDSYFYGTININIMGGEITGNIYGAGAGGVTGYNQNSSDPYKTYGEDFDTNVNINISNGTIGGDIYGGGYGYTEYLNANVTAVDGGALYGNSNIIISGTPTINGNIFAAGCGYDFSSKPNIAQMIGNSKIDISGTPTIRGSIFGGGAGLDGFENMAKLTGTSRININANLSSGVYGGGNIAKTSGQTNISISSGNHTGDIFGGGNVGILDGTANVTIAGGTQDRVFGGGNEATATTTNVYINGGETEEVYGGGNLASVTTTNVYLQGGIATNIYAGSNQSGDVTTANLTTTSGSATNVYGGNNQGGTVSNTNVLINGGTITNVFGGNNQGGTILESLVTVEKGTLNNVYGGGDKAVSGTTQVYIKGGEITNLFGGGNEATTTETKLYIQGGTIENAYGGGNLASVTTTNVYIEGGMSENIFAGSNQSGNVATANLTSTSGNATNVYGGNNQGGTVTNSYIVINDGNITNIYGGNNERGTTSIPHISVKGGIIGNIYGGGNRATVPTTNVTIENGNINNIFGGGNAAGVDNDTTVTIIGGIVENNVYGGGNEGIVQGSSNVKIKNATVKGSAYAGGNGSTAIVYENATITIEGNTIIGTIEEAVSPHKGSVFGGGNAAATGRKETNNSVSTVNIVGGIIYGNVYGGANTSVVYGITRLNLGYETIQDTNLIKSDIYIRGTIFGGGEANAAGSEVYDFSFISVTEGIEIEINGASHTSFKTEGSIFGSGNASSTSGYSYINIKNYGTIENPNRNISIQRADTVTIENSSILLLGTTDSTNELSWLEYALSRIDHLKIKDNTTLYLNAGGNLLKKMSSLVDIDGTETLAQVLIDEETGETQKNVDNRIYMKEGQILNLVLNSQKTVYGEVDGMTFLGVYTNNNNPNESTGFYNYQFNNGDEITNAGTFVNNGKVAAMHEANHDIHVDGFYTNYNNEGYIKTGYVGVTPDEDIYYIWTVGEEMQVTTIPMELVASKFATLGTKEEILAGFSKPNTAYQVIGFTPDLTEGVSLVDSGEIEPIAPTNDDANNIFGLSMRTAKKRMVNKW